MLHLLVAAGVVAEIGGAAALREAAHLEGHALRGAFAHHQAIAHRFLNDFQQIAQTKDEEVK